MDSSHHIVVAPVMPRSRMAPSLLNLLTYTGLLVQPAASAVHPPHSLGQSETTSTTAASQALASFCVACSLAHLTLSPQVAVTPPCMQDHAQTSSGDDVCVGLVASVLVVVEVSETVRDDEDLVANEVLDAVPVLVVVPVELVAVALVVLSVCDIVVDVRVVGHPLPSYTQHQAFHSAVHAVCHISYSASQLYSGATCALTSCRVSMATDVVKNTLAT